MADFRQLALQFVLSDEETKQTSLAQEAATEIKNALPNDNPVARWVESVQPWMPGNKDDVMEDGQDTPDWNARAKALQFLSSTLRYVDADVLKSSQVKLLVAFFGAMLDVDHKAGVSASATALSRIVSMKNFVPSSGSDILSKICALRDDFNRQLSKTRLQVYELIQLLISDDRVRSDLKRRDENSLDFISKLVEICSSERDPDCLMIWFDILQQFINRYEPSQTILDQLFGNFKSYFPITLPRTSQTGVTPEELKMALRRCFSSSSLLASSVVTFLLGKLDQGDTLTVNVKLDILRTLKACFEEYSNPETSILPFVSQVWTSLKYEVRNGELEDTIWATLEVLKTIATRLSGDGLRDYTLMVTRDCVADLSNPTYTAQAGRLLISVLSANPTAFVLMASPTLTHVKENLRHPKSPAHSEDLHKILHIVLETRILVSEINMTSEEKRDFGAVDPLFNTLYNDVYKTCIAKSKESDAQEEDIKIAIQVVQGAGALVCQPAITAVEISGEEDKQKKLLSADASSQICEALFSVILHGCMEENPRINLDGLTNWATLALQRTIVAHPTSFHSVVTQSIELMNSSHTSARQMDSLGPLVAFVGCSALPSTKSVGLDQFHTYAVALTKSLLTAINSGSRPRVWASLAASLQVLVRSFNDACEGLKNQETAHFEKESWLHYVSNKYPSLRLADEKGDSPMDVDSTQTNAVENDLHADFLLSTLYLVRILYQRTLTTEIVEGETSISIRPDLANGDETTQQQYLHQLSTIAGLVVHEMTDGQQASFQVEKDALFLFTENESREASINSIPSLKGTTPFLQFGILQALRPTSVARLFDSGAAQQLLAAGISTWSATPHSTHPLRAASLAILANRFKIETQASLIKDLEEKASSSLRVLASDESSASEDQKPSIDSLIGLQAILSGVLRRSPGKDAQGLVQLLRSLPKAKVVGAVLAQKMDKIAAPQDFLDKKSFAIVRPLWMQKTYMDLVKPMLSVAVGEDAEVTDPLVKMNHSVAVALILQHMTFSIFESDVAQVVRISIATAQILETGREVKAALLILHTILHEAADALADHLRSILQICVKVLTGRLPQDRPEWLPANYVGSGGKRGQGTSKMEAECGDLSLQIMAAIPRSFESRLVVPLRASAERELTLACGHRIRRVRETARVARKNWTETK